MALGRDALGGHEPARFLFCQRRAGEVVDPLAAEQVKNKPPQAIAKIVEGKMEKFYQGYCLVDQGFVKKNSEVSVKEHVAQVARQLGDEITIRRFVRFQVGEVAA